MTASVSAELKAQRSPTERDCFQTVRGPNLSYADRNDQHVIKTGM